MENTDAIRLGKWGDAQGTEILVISNWTDGGELIISGVYNTNLGQ
jgi:hypothetical protein